VGRLAGDEFAIVIPGADADAGAAIAAHVISALDRQGVRVSIGFASCSGASRTAHELIAEADRALLDAKIAGKHRLSTIRAA
jgi:diguanylate cyclase (GGDEF)-like protein